MFSKKNPLTEFFNTLIGLFYPPHCAGCNTPILAKKFLCAHCWSKTELISEHHCQICSYQLSSSLDSKSCPNCIDRKFHFTSAVSSFRYQGLVRNLIFQFKYGRNQSLKKLLGLLILPALEDERLTKISFTAVVPVPLYSLREREREFNQAKLLANEVAQHLRLPICDILKRVKPTSSQARADRRERIKNLTGAFVIKEGRHCSGNYLLVDDVFTTGSTADECAKTLIKSGANGVWAVAAARS